MGKLMHICKKMPEGRKEALGRLYGWDRDEEVLTDAITRDGQPKHTVCPNGCDTPREEWKAVPTEDAAKLETNLRARGSHTGTPSTEKATNATLIAEIKAMRKELAAVKKGGKD
jgi:hypothetical protein